MLDSENICTKENIQLTKKKHLQSWCVLILKDSQEKERKFHYEHTHEDSLHFSSVEISCERSENNYDSHTYCRREDKSVNIYSQFECSQDYKLTHAL